MNSSKLNYLCDVAERKNLSSLNSQVRKFVKFCELHELKSNPDEWDPQDFSEELIGKYVTWLINFGKNCQPLSSHQEYITGIRSYLEKKFRSVKGDLPFKKDED